MNAGKDFTDGNSEAFAKIRSARDEFRKQLKIGRQPKIESFLQSVPIDAQEELFSQLLQIDIAYRNQSGATPSSSEYVSRFPQFAKIIRQAFFESTIESSEQKPSPSPKIPNTFEETIELKNIVGDYELIDKIGEGGFGVVYEARHLKRGHKVALKTLHTRGDRPLVDADRLYRFRREFRSLSDINHPNLVGMQSLEVDGDRWYLTMDLIDGVDFLSYVRPSGSLDEERLRESIKQLVTGIVALHQRGIVHRDLKPNNVLVDSEGHVSILDFGLVSDKQRQSEQTGTARSETFAGTPRYAAPEQLFGERSEASDWYAFGTMLYEALIGSPPFEGGMMEVMRQKQEQNPPALSERADISTDLARLVDDLLQRDPALRLTTQSIVDTLGVDSASTTHGSLDEGDADPFLSAGVDQVLIGREEQLDELETAKTKFLEKRRASVVYVTGLSGEGKSTLIEQFLRPLRRSRELLVLSGRCYDRESVPFKVIDSQIDSLVRFLRSQEVSQVEQWLPEDIDMLAHLFPSLHRVRAIDRRGKRSKLGFDDLQIRNLAFAAFRELLERIGIATPILMFVDDLQWGDADSASVLFEMIQSTNAPSLLLIGSYRKDERDSSPYLNEWYKRERDLSSAEQASEVQVEPLTLAQCFEFLQSRIQSSANITEHHARELFENTKGNPYFLEQFLEGFDKETGRFQLVPLPDLIKRRLRRSPDGAESLLQAVAVAGKAVPLAEIAEVTGQRSSTFTTIPHMRSERLVRLVGEGEDQFVDTYHDKIRETVLASMGEVHVQDLHRHYGETLKARSSTENSNGKRSIDEVVNDLAHHFYEAKDERGFQYQLLAGKAALEACALTNAYDHLEKARGVRPESIEDEIAYDVEYTTGRALLGLGESSRSLTPLQNALTLATNSIDRSNTLSALAEASWNLGKTREALANLDVAFREFGERVPRSIVMKLFHSLLTAIGFHFFPRWMSWRLIRKGPEVLGELSVLYDNYAYATNNLDVYSFIYSSLRSCYVGRLTENPVTKSNAYASYALVLAFAGVPWLSRHMLNRSERYVIESRSKVMGGINDVNLGICLYCYGQLEEAESSLMKGDEVLERAGAWRRMYALHFLRHLWSVVGDAERIDYFAKSELKLADKDGDLFTVSYGQYGMADARSRAGDFELGVQAGLESTRNLQHVNGNYLCVAYQELGRAQLQASQYAEARTSLARGLKEVLKFRVLEITAPTFPLYAEAIAGSEWFQPKSISSTDRRRARRWAWVGRLTGMIFPNNRAHALRVSGRIAACRGNRGKAKKFFEKAISFAAKKGARCEHARALIDKSMLEGEGSQSDRQQGIDELEQLGCVLPSAEVDRLGIDRDEHHQRAALARENKRSQETKKEKADQH